MDTHPAPATYRSAPRRARLVRELVFDRLAPAVRDRLTRGIVNGAPPDPLLAVRSSTALRALRGLLAATIGAAVGGFSLWMWDLGSLRGQRAIQPLSYAAAYGALLFIALAAGAAVIHLRRNQRGAPFPSGCYLFALDLVEVTGGYLRITTLDTLRRVEARGRGVALIFEDGYEVAFPLAKHEDIAAVAAKLTAEIEAARQLSYPADEIKLERMDPFYEVRVSDDWAAAAGVAGARRRSALVWTTVVAAIAAAPGGYGILRARNGVSDDRMFEEATRTSPGESRGQKLAAYVERGRRHHGEMANLLIEAANGDRGVLMRYAARGGALGEAADAALFELTKGDSLELTQIIKGGGPRAAEADDALFALMKQRDQVYDYEMYLKVGELHADEVKRALMPEADWKEASKSAIVGPLVMFARRNPGTKHEEEVWKRFHAAYGEARARYQQTSKAPAEGKRFAEALLAYLEARGDPRVDLAIRILPSDAVSATDAALGAKFGGRYLPGAPRFSEKERDSLQFFVNESVAGYFASTFPRGTAEAVEPDGKEGRPRIEITMNPAPSGSSEWRSPLATSDKEPKYMSALVALEVEVRCVVPGREGKAEAKMSWKLRVEDTSTGKILGRTSDGIDLTPQEMIDYAYWLAVLRKVPEQIAATFPEHF